MLHARVGFVFDKIFRRFMELLQAIKGLQFWQKLYSFMAMTVLT